MENTLTDFYKRATEIELYFDFLSKLSQKDTTLHYKESTKNHSVYINKELLTILRANCFLLLYNLIESSFKNALWEILGNIQAENLSYDEISEKIQELWIQEQAWIKRDYTSKKFANLIKEATNVILNEKIKFNQNLIFQQLSGNVDAKRIIELSQKYGFEMPQLDGEIAEILNKIKENRNYLSHGNLTFADCGKDYSTDEIVLFKDRVLNYMEKIINNINFFIESKNYLKSPE